jgi:hypothetical protein
LGEQVSLEELVIRQQERPGMNTKCHWVAYHTGKQMKVWKQLLCKPTLQAESLYGRKFHELQKWAIIRTKVFTNFLLVKFNSQNVNIPISQKYNIFATAKSKNVVISWNNFSPIFN